MEPAAEHSAQELWHTAHAALEPASSTNVPLPHSATHPPLETKGVAALVQERHSDADGPEHVPQAVSHSSQREAVASAYMPSGVQSETQLEEALTKKGCVEAQLAHSPGSALSD